ncbi:dcm, DNA (cytosine-5-)-methyltransferase [uncultured Caudovirales phage]|uniref:Cytosine-specific methyltransferase n=1 Tax=uncultured Caudovirales phage TaxID=2100421 RepID=A0A6J5MV93_9CAUD|nr:dcm, DNA (cytosine-5-)-methyltransferase [uncultured Caudovirales phage]
MRHGSLFSGIGGFDLASEWMGWENVFHCEWMEFPRKVLDYYWADADSHIDICKTDFKKYEGTIDIITGGFPCQPFSTAGKRKGTDDERYLWGEMLRAIQEIKPTFVIAENVFGITNIDGGLVFEQVCLDLEAEGYEVQPFIIPAAAKNAPHRRDRCWFIAQNPLFSRCIHRESNQERAKVWKFRNTCTRSADGIHLSKRDATHTNGIGCGGRSEQSKSNQSEEREICENEQQYRDGVRCEIEGCSWDVTNTKNIGRKNALENGELERGRFRFGNKSHTWNTFPLESPVCGGDDGLPTKLDGITFSKWRAESIKGYGNAIVPQVAYELFKQLEQL